MHQFLPLRKFLDEIFLCRLLLLYFSARFSSSYTELLSIRVCKLVFVGSLRSEAVRIQAIPSVANTTISPYPTELWKYCDWLNNIWHFHFCCVLVFLGLLWIVTFSKYEQVNRAMAGRSRSTAIVRGSLFFFSKSHLFVLFWVIDQSINL